MHDTTAESGVSFFLYSLVEILFYITRLYDQYGNPLPEMWLCNDWFGQGHNDSVVWRRQSTGLQREKEIDSFWRKERKRGEGERDGEGEPWRELRST